MNRNELINALNELVVKSEIYATDPFGLDSDPADWHEKADGLLLQYINDKEISELFDKIEKWYS